MPITADNSVNEEPKKTAVNQKPPAAKDAGVMLQSRTDLRDPYEDIMFKANRPRRVAAVTVWMQGQIDAGLIKKV